MAEQAWQDVCEAFWQAAEDQAHGLGLGGIEQEGRSGGWLVLTSGDDPADMQDYERREWLGLYRALRDWCEAAIAAAPSDLADALEAMAADMAVAP